MTSNINDIGKKALELSNHDRALLIRKLLQSLEEGEEEEENSERLWVQESKTRYDRYKRGKTSENPAGQVMKNARNKLK